MDTSYVAVGTVMYMITDSLACCPQEKPRRSGAQHERAGRAGCALPARPALPPASPGRTASGTAILHGLARRTAADLSNVGQFQPFQIGR